MNFGTCTWSKAALSIAVLVLLSIACNSVSKPEPADQDTLPSTILSLPDAVDAGPDQTVGPGVLVEISATPMANGQVWVEGLSGAGSDVELQVFWQQLNGPQISLTHPAAPTTSFIAPEAQDDAVVLSFKALLRLEDGTSYTDVVQVIVTTAAEDDDPLNPASENDGGAREPIADAGDDLFAQPGEVVVLDGSASSDPAGLPLEFSWSQRYGPKVELSRADEEMARFIAPHIGEDYHLAFTLTVSNGAAEASATVMVHVTEPGDGGPLPAAGPIAADAGPDQYAQCSNLVTLDGGGSTGDDLGYLWVQTAGFPVNLLTYDEVTTSFIAPAVADGATLVFELIVNVGDLYASDEVTVFVAACPDNPDLLLSHLCPGGCDDGNPCTIDECVDGTCFYSPVECPAGEVCNPDSGACVEACAGVACDDGDPCTTDTCDPDTAECVFTPMACAEGLFCVDGACVECESDAQCDDQDLCTTNACVSSACVFTPVACPEGEFCVAGACVHCEGDEDCDDGDPCTLDTCNLVTGECLKDPVECPGDLLCLDGDCVECRFDDDCPDDGNDCTDTMCTAVHECAYPPLASGTACGDPSDADCDDPDTCDGDGNCLENLEPSGTVCSVDGDDCTDDMCDGSGTCTHPAKAAGSPCGNQADTECDDPDTCDGAGTCLDNYEPAGTPCDDDAFCTGDDFCSEFGYCDQHTGDPCAADETCDEGDDACVPDGSVENSPPTVSDQSGSTFEDTSVLLTLYGQDDDGDDLTFFIVNPPSHGTLGALDNGPVSFATVTYIPAGGYVGSDSFTFYASDGEDDSNTATFSITINETPQGTVYYVDDNGPDQPGYDAGALLGSIHHPFATIQAAANTVASGDTVYIRAGIYYEQVNISANGTPNARITFTNYNDEIVVIDAEYARSAGIYIGPPLVPAAHRGNYVTIDGLQVRKATSNNVTVRWADNVILRNLVTTLAEGGAGIIISGETPDVIVEYCTSHDNHRLGIVVAKSVKDSVVYKPTNPTVRWCHVYRNIGDAEDSDGIEFRSSLGGVLEHCVVHDNIDGQIDVGSPGATLRYNICYFDYPGGNSAVLKTGVEPDDGGHVINHNVCFSAGALTACTKDSGAGNHLYHNVAYRLAGGMRSQDGTTISTAFNNISLATPDDEDFHFPGNADFNLSSDGSAAGLHSITYEDPAFAGLELLDADLQDVSGPGGSVCEDVPGILRPLLDSNAFLTPGGNVDTEAAILYAKQQMVAVFGLQPISPAIDGALSRDELEMPIPLTDLVGNEGCDDPGTVDPWPAESGTGLDDLGAIEYVAPCQ